MIYTFYSFKGGVGRSMALANIAEAFHEKGLRVAMIDWDLEAPGLETYFYPQEQATQGQLNAAREHVGLIDMLGEYQREFPVFVERTMSAAAPAVVTSPEQDKEIAEASDVIAKILQAATDLPEFMREPRARSQVSPEPQTYGSFLATLYAPAETDGEPAHFPGVLATSCLRKYLQCIHPPENGRDNGLYLLSAGARSGDRFGPYAVAVQDFDWSEFYAVYDGAEYFMWLRARLMEVADVVLIDSRTGVTEMGGVCTRFMADAVIAFCAPNFQNVDGVVNVMSGVNRDKVMEARDNRLVDVLIVPTRIDDSESGLLGEFKDRFWTAVEEPAALPDAANSSAASTPDLAPGARLVLPKHLRRLDRPQWNLQIPYVPRYNYREQRVIGNGAATPDPVTAKLIAAYMKLVTYLAVLADDGTRVRNELARELAREFPHVQPGVLICRTSAAVAEAALDLRAWLKTQGVGLREDLDISGGGNFERGVDLARAVILLVTPETIATVAVRDVVRHARRMGRSLQVVLIGSVTAPSIPTWLQSETILRSEDRDTLLAKLASRGVVRRVPFMAPRPADRAVARPALLERIRTSLAQPSPVVLCGAGGIGKSTLAALHCHEENWDDRYPGGVLWIEAADVRDLAPHYRTLADALLGEESVSQDPRQNRAAVVRRIDEARTLLVLNDVVLPEGDEWKRNLTELVELARRGACLITTRNGTLAAKVGAIPIVVGPLNYAESVALLRSRVPGLSEADPELPAITLALGESPLALTLASDVAARAAAEGGDPAGAVHRLRADLDANGVVAFDVPGTLDASRSVGVSVRSGLARMSREERARLEGLAGIENPFSLESAQRAWNTTPERTQQLLARFATECFVVSEPGGLSRLDPLVAEYFRTGRQRAAISRPRGFQSSTDRATNPDVKRAEQILSETSLPPLDELRALAERLKGRRYFDLAQQLFARARLLPGLDAKMARRLAQRQALCTYKDLDRPADSRLDVALEILNKADKLSRSTDQETLGLAGAIYKNRWALDGHASHLERSLAYYRRGFKLGPDNDYGYTAINTAFVLDLLAADEDRIARELESGSTAAEARRLEATQVREEIVKKVEPLRDTPGVGASWWFQVTIAEAYFGLVRFAEAQVWLRKALTADVDPWEYEATARQFAALAALQRESGTLRPEQLIESEETMKLLLGHDARALASVALGKVGLALSGGGFRASLFHIGVLARLAELDVLRHVEVLSCVSGGSIIGAHYYLEVKRLLESKADEEITADDYLAIVQRIEVDFLEGVQRNVRTRVALNPMSSLKTALVPNYSRTERVGELYEQEIFSRVKGVSLPLWLDQLFVKPKDAREGFTPKLDNWRRSAKVPILVLNATTLNTGHNWQFTASWMGESPAAISSEIDANDLLRRMYYWEAPAEHQHVRLGSAVAASSCVPGLFEPLVLPRLYPERTVQLIDGGVHDNQGIGGLIEQDCAVMLVSDASGHLASQNKPPTEMVDVLPRSNGILMARVREAEFRELDARKRGGALRGFLFLHLKKDLDVAPVNWVNAPRVASPPVQAEMTNYGVQRDVQNALANVRTDLDSFCDAEAYALMLSGYRMTAREFDRSLPRFLAQAGSVVKTDLQNAVSSNGAGTWRFLSVDDAVRKERGHEEAHKSLLKQLSASQSTWLKVWRVAPMFAVAAMLLLAGAIVVGLRQLHVDWSIASTLFGSFGHAVLIGAVVVAVAGPVFRWAEIPKSVTQLVLGLALLIVGSIGAATHLLFYDPLYLAWGRVVPETGRQRLRTLARIVGGAAAPAAIVLFLLGLLATWQRSGIDDLRAQARAALARGSYDQVLSIWGQVVRVFPDDVEARTGLARAHLTLGQSTQALQAVALMTESTDPSLLRIRAAANRQLGNMRAAADDYDRILTASPRDAQVLRDRAYVRRELGEYGGSLDDYTRSLEIEPNAQAEQDKAYVTWLLSRDQSGAPAPPSPPAASMGVRGAPAPAPEPAPALAPVRPRVYVQWASSSQARDLALLVQRLNALGYDVPRPEQVSAVPQQTELRYYFDSDKPAADRVTRELAGAGLQVTVKKVAGDRSRLGHLELWLAKDIHLSAQ